MQIQSVFTSEPDEVPPSKGPYTSEISTLVFLECGEEISPIHSTINNMSMCLTACPSIQKRGKTVADPVIGVRGVCVNYGI